MPAIWLLELDKIERRLQQMNGSMTNVNVSSAINDSRSVVAGVGSVSSVTGSSAVNNSAIAPMADLLDDAGITLPVISPDTWTTLIEQFLMLILIVGRWLLPKGDLTRDQLSQLLLVYIGTAADIIEFFDSYKDDSIARIGFLVFLTLGIWSWSLMQFTIVLSATRGRRPRGSGSHHKEEWVTVDNNKEIVYISSALFPILQAYGLLPELLLRHRCLGYSSISISG